MFIFVATHNLYLDLSWPPYSNQLFIVVQKVIACHYQNKKPEAFKSGSTLCNQDLQQGMLIYDPARKNTWLAGLLTWSSQSKRPVMRWSFASEDMMIP